MYAKLGKGARTIRALRYNEEKISHGTAEFLASENFVKAGNLLTKEDKLDRFLQRTSLNERASGILPISINFDVSEKISNEQMLQVAKRYMAVIGFEKQPYLVYRHYDAGHPHCHIVTTRITKDGDLLRLSRGDLVRSHRLSKEIEREFSLVRRIKQEDGEKFRVRQAQRVVYGQSSLKHGISDALNTVFDHYRYTSLPEFNAILHLYRVQADRGSENSRIYKTGGLIYHALDENERRIGKSIKASDFFLKPTLANLEKKFALNASLEQANQQRVKAAIDWTLAGTPPDWEGFQQAMGREGIDVVLQSAKKDGAKDIFFVDHDSKAVFGGARLGPSYLLEAIRQRCSAEQIQEQEQEETQRHRLRLGL
ncbi:MAG TPA: relaxase/mobilization nuclease domain-containing protein [Puia sp.]|nr:relaxase/mobilization nuclease domain-containing protein [Puia sp.]